FRHLLDAHHELQVSLEVLSLKTRVVAPPVVGREIVRRLEAAGEEPAAERAVGDEPDPQLTAQRKNLLLRIARPKRVLGLQRRDAVHAMRATDRVGGRLGEAEIADLPRFHELRHRADRVLDRRVWIDAMLIVKVDSFDAEAFQRSVARLPHVLRPAADSYPCAVRLALVAL